MRAAILLFISAQAWASEVTVQSTGASPAVLLQYHIPDKAKQRAHIRFDVDVNVSAGGVGQVQHAPTVDAWIDIKASDLGDGTYNLAFVYKKVKVTGGQGEMASKAIKDELMKLKGASGAMHVSASGELLTADLGITDASGATTKLPFDMRDLGARFPSEPVGVGAEWTLVSEVPTQLGVTFDQTTTYKLLELGGGTALIDVTMAQTAPPGPLDPAAAGVDGLSGASIDLVSSVATGNGQYRIDLSKPFVTDGKLEIQLDMVMTMAMMGVSQTLEQHVATHMLLLPK